MTAGPPPGSLAAFGWSCHREERSDAAIQELRGALPSLDCNGLIWVAMTTPVLPQCNLLSKQNGPAWEEARPQSKKGRDAKLTSR